MYNRLAQFKGSRHIVGYLQVW